MSIMQSIMETAARFLPDKERDLLMDRDGYVGKSLTRVDARAKVKGEARFTAEFNISNLSYAVLVHSTIAKGKAVRIETGPAERAAGVLAVITHENVPEMKAPPNPDFSNLGKGFALSNLPIMGSADIHWDGEPVAVIVAETVEQAEYAASLVHVYYEAGTPVVSFEKTKTEAVVPHDILGEPPEIKIGDVNQGMVRAEVNVDHVYRTPRYNHNAIEPHATIAVWNSDGGLTVFDATQSVNLTAHTLAYVFDLKREDVRVVAPFVGGGFGGKVGLWNHIALCAAAAKFVCRPVKLALTREGVFRAIGGRTISEQRVALGATKGGELTALIHTGITATTADTRYAEQCTFPARHLYASPNLFVGQKMVYLDTVANTWMRAPGESIGTFALESAIDELAYELKMDPIELRRVNEPTKDPTKDTEFSSRQLMEAYRRGAEKFGWGIRNPALRSQKDGKWLVGQGVATAYYPYFRFPAKASLRISVDGSAIVQTPAAEMGMGTATAQIQHAADRLGLPIDRVSFEYGDSKLPDTPIMAGGSNQTATIFAAVQAAVEEAHRELMKLAHKRSDSPLAGAKYEQVEARNGGLFRVGAEQGETYSTILEKAGQAFIEVETSSGLPMELMKYSMASYGAQFCEVRVHEETGEVRVSRWLGSFDCGKIVNPTTGVSQLRGGIVMGIGMALTEETLFDERRGRIMNPSLAEYHVPVNLDVPHIEIIYNDIPDEHAPAGARGIGEIGITGVAASIANAVFHATGKRIRDLPITLDKLL